MKFVKSISLFLIIPAVIFVLGFFLVPDVEEKPGVIQKEDGTQTKFRAASASDEQLVDADTKFIVEEVDLRRDTLVETQWQLPEKYIGMNREEFLRAMDEY